MRIAKVNQIRPAIALSCLSTIANTSTVANMCKKPFNHLPTSNTICYTWYLKDLFPMPQNIANYYSSQCWSFCCVSCAPHNQRNNFQLQEIPCQWCHKVWTTAFCKEFGNFVQGDVKKNIAETDKILVMTWDQMKNTPKDRVVTHARRTVVYRPQKENSNWVCHTAGGNLIAYPTKLTTYIVILQLQKYDGIVF